MGDKHTEEQVVFVRTVNSGANWKLYLCVQYCFVSSVLAVNPRTPGTQTSGHAHCKGGNIAMVFGKMGMLQSAILNA